MDISFNQKAGIDAGNQVVAYLASFPSARPLIMLLKYFLKSHALAEPFTGGLGTHVLVMMVIFFLQRVAARDHVGNPERNIGLLLLDFLAFYGVQFNWYTTGISTLDGGRFFAKDTAQGFSYGGKLWRPFVQDCISPCSVPSLCACILFLRTHMYF